MQSLILRKQVTRLTTTHQSWMVPSVRYYSEYKPWSNEYSVSGTTRDTMERKVASDNTVDPAKELNETREEAKSNGGEDVLEWSAANQRMSDIPAGREGLWTSADTLAVDKTPSSCHYQPPKEGPLHEGLYKPLKRPVYKRYCE
ncbi:hypothetical protein BDA99DRAFT_499409 [Phascolomyces articulosus]|uniref:Uncharacterized protein n=1 Tax=Phascolomyces articulosus TaxID=60185 RepID=A0AAD5K7X1_9FUNG|nr:hypothetical protein BDA99DRAFT_499409 [Phascolomyces articulosus]